MHSAHVTAHKNATNNIIIVLDAHTNIILTLVLMINANIIRMKELILALLQFTSKINYAYICIFHMHTIHMSSKTDFLRPSYNYF